MFETEEGDTSCRGLMGQTKDNVKRKPDGKPRRKSRKSESADDSVKNLFLGAAIGVLITCVITYALLSKSPSMCKTKSHRLFRKFWEWRMSESPEFATFAGFHKFDDRLESYDLKAFQSRKIACEEFLVEANTLLSDGSLDTNCKKNLELFSAELNTFIHGISAKGYLFPINNLEGVHIELERLVSAMKYENVDDYRKLISRFKSFPVQVSEIIELLREGIRLKMTNHKVSVDNVIKQIDALLAADLETSPLLKPVHNIPESIEPVERSVLKEEVENALKVDVLTSFNKLKVFLETEYLKHLRPNESVSSIPNGIEFYQKCLNFHLGYTTTPKEVHNVGLQEVERISKEIEKVIQKLELDVSQKEFLHKMKSEKEFLFRTEEELLETYKGIVFNTIQPKLPQIIKKIPSLKLSIEPSPPSMATGPVAYYLAGTPDGSRPGVFYINSGQINESPKYEAVTLSLHEAEPGHHLQISYMMEMPDVPTFRQHLEDRRYSDGPSRFPLHTSYIEGWGLYSEFLGYELNLYDDPYLEYGHLSFEMFRACRLVVDTGIHAFGWSKEKAVDFMVEHTGMHKHAIEKEIYRYITWPGQACAYKIGELKIKELRRKAEDALGPKFDVREFHDVVLQSAGPLYLLEQNVNEFIQNYKK